jgi:hypothetical protein
MIADKVLSVNFNQIFEGVRQYKWHQVGLNTMYYDYDAVTAWLNEHCAKRVRFHCALFVFEDEHDATLFALRWL